MLRGFRRKFKKMALIRLRLQACLAKEKETRNVCGHFCRATNESPVTKIRLRASIGVQIQMVPRKRARL